VHDAEYYYRPHTTVAKYLGFEFNDIGFSTGKHHRLVRKLCATQLLSHESLNKYEYIRNEARATMINTVWKSASHGNVIEVRDILLDFTTNVLCRMLMSRTHLDIANIGLGFKQETFKSLVQEIMEVVGKLDTSMFIPWMRWLDLEGRTIELKELNRRLVKYFKGVIEEHEKSLESEDRAHESNDILDVLLSLEGDDMLSDEAIMGILLVRSKDCKTSCFSFGLSRSYIVYQNNLQILLLFFWSLKVIYSVSKQSAKPLACLLVSQGYI
jgi:cytochrome P450